MRGGMVIRMPFIDGNGWFQVCRQGLFLRHWMAVIYRDGKYHMLYGGPVDNPVLFEGYIPIMYFLEFYEIGGKIHATAMLFGDVRPGSDLVIGRGDVHFGGQELRAAAPYEVSGYSVDAPFRAKMTVGMLGVKGEYTIELGDFATRQQAVTQAPGLADDLMDKMPPITIEKKVVVESLETGQELVIR